MRGVSYRFTAFDEMWEAVTRFGDGELPVQCGAAFRDGEWVVVTCSVEGRNLMVPGRVRFHAEGSMVVFETRDWRRLCGFAERGAAGAPSRPRPVFRSSEFSIEPPHSSSVVLVDDDADVQAMVAAVVTCAGFTVRCESTAEEALASLRGSRADLVVTAAELPGMSGLELCKLLGALPGACPVMVLTASSLDGDIRQVVAAGAADYLAKPFRTAELSARMLSLLRQVPDTVCGPSRSGLDGRASRRATR